MCVSTLYVCVCVCVCVCNLVHACMYVYIHPSTVIQYRSCCHGLGNHLPQAHIIACQSWNTPVHVHTDVHTQTHNYHTHLRMYTSVHPFIHTHTHTHTCMYIHLCIHTYAYVLKYTHTHTHTHTCTCKHQQLRTMIFDSLNKDVRVRRTTGNCGTLLCVKLRTHNLCMTFQRWTEDQTLCTLIFLLFSTYPYMQE